MDFNALIAYGRRAMSLEVPFYEEAARNESMTRDALNMVIVVAVLNGLGAFIGQLLGLNFLAAFAFLIVQTILSVALYYVAAYVTQYVGAAMFKGQGTQQQMLRTLGFAHAPQALSVLSFIPCVGPFIALAAGLWYLVCGFFAVRTTHRLTDGQAIITMFIAWLIVLVITAVVLFFVGVIVGVPAALLNMATGQ
jgi:hypothetical protein